MADFADIVEEIKKTNKKLDKLTQATDPSGASATEDKRDRQRSQKNSEEYLKTIAGAMGTAGGAGGADALDPEDKKRGGLLAGIGGALGGLGIGAGVAMGGLGALFAGGGYLLKQLSEFDGAAVKKNILELISIGDALVDKEGSILGAFGKTGLLIFMLAGIGAGLAAFSIGSMTATAATGVDDAISMFVGTKSGMGTDWATKIKDNIETLLSIEIKSMGAVAGLAATMTALAAGIVAFSIGSTTAAVAEGITSAIAMFTDSGGSKGGPPGTEKKGWATKIKDNIETLLSIKTASVLDTSKIVGTMAALGAALIAFSFGTIAAEAAVGIGDAIAMFTGKGDEGTGWAEKIKDNVEMLLSIETIEGLDTVGLIATMGGIGAALVAFSIGQVAAKASEGIGAAIDMFTGKSDEGIGWAEKIKDNIETLLSIKTESALDTGGLVVTMGALGAALVAFSIGQVAAEASAGIGAAIGMFTNSGGSEGGPPGTQKPGWAQSIKDNIETLLSIKTESALDTTGIIATMGGLGAGLVAFSIGKTVAGASEGIDSAISMFTGKKEGMGTGWAESIKKEVETLLSIKTESVLKTAGIVLTLGALGLGLIVFSIGKLIGAGADAAVAAFSPSKEEQQAGFDKFSTSGWAQIIVDEVTILLEIANLAIGDAAEFVVTMGMIGAGLVAFGVGKIVAGAAEGLVTGVDATKSAIDQFSEGGFAQNILDEVTTLLKIAKLPLGDAAAFVAHMVILAGGLVAFSFGKGVAGFAEGINRLAGIGQEGNKSFADKIHDEVTTLLSIVDNPNATEEKVTQFTSVMSKMAEGLTTFAGGQFVSALAGAGTAIVNFFTGGESPIDEMLKVAGSADELTKGADALDRIAGSLGKISDLEFSGDSIKMKDFAEDLLESMPAIEAAIMGGKIEGGWLSSDHVYKGLASGEIKWADAAANIDILLKAFRIKEGDSDLGIGSGSRQGGGPIRAGKPYMVGEGGPEMIIPSTAGQVLNAQRTAQMQQASLRNSVGTGGGQSVLNNMPISNISTSQNNTTVTATPLMHPSPIIGMVNSAA